MVLVNYSLFFTKRNKNNTILANYKTLFIKKSRKSADFQDF